MLWWNDELETGVKSIDMQHKSIFDKSNEIFDMGEDTDIEDLEEVISFLMCYTNNHFSDEEQLMLENQYSEFIEHRRQHNLFVEEIYKLYLRVEKNEINEDLFNDLKVIIIEWFARHINTSDKEFVEYFNTIE